MSVGLVIVSHSRKLAEGVVELAGQMAPDVRVRAAGGLPDGALGTDYELVAAAVSDAGTGAGVVLLHDLGSAQMTAELVVESLGDPASATVADAPLVEGAVAAAVAAQNGQDLEAVVRAASGAITEQMTEAGEPGAGAAGQAAAQQAVEELELRNEVGLHARPAAMLARSLTGLDAAVTVSLGGREADATSVLGLMGLGARKGDTVEIRARGADAEAAVRRIRDLADRNFED